MAGSTRLPDKSGRPSRRVGTGILLMSGFMAGSTRLELATSCVTGRRSNQLNYDPVKLTYVFSVSDLPDESGQAF